MFVYLSLKENWRTDEDLGPAWNWSQLLRKYQAYPTSHLVLVSVLVWGYRGRGKKLSSRFCSKLHKFRDVIGGYPF